MYIRSALAPLTGLTILSIANGYLTSMISIVLSQKAYEEFEISLVVSGFYLGVMIGAFLSSRLIYRVGYIRSFSVCSVIFIIVIGMQSLSENIWLWVLLRIVGGVMVAGIFVVVESWLLLESFPEERGGLLAVYMLLYYCASAVGQKLLGFYGVDGYIPYMVVLILTAFSMLPVLIQRSIEPPRFMLSVGNIFKLYVLTPTGFLGCVISGILTGVVYGIMPMYFSQQGFNLDSVGNYMAILFAGGMLLQYPLGKFSDMSDRRWVLAGVSILGGVSSLFLAWSVFNEWYMLWLFLLGGAIFALYPLSISHGCDHATTEEVVPSIQGLLLAFSFGSVIGPILVFSLLQRSENSLFYIISFIIAAFSLFVLLRIRQRIAIYTGPDDNFVPLLTYTPVSSELSPRKEEVEDEEE